MSVSHAAGPYPAQQHKRRQLPDRASRNLKNHAARAARQGVRPPQHGDDGAAPTTPSPAKSHRTRSPATRVATSTPAAPRHGATVGGTLPFAAATRKPISPTLVQQEKEKARILSLKLADSITESEAYAFLRPLVMGGDVAQLSTQLRQAMEEEFGVPLAHRRQFIDPIVMRILSERARGGGGGRGGSGRGGGGGGVVRGRGRDRGGGGGAGGGAESGLWGGAESRELWAQAIDAAGSRSAAEDVRAVRRRRSWAEGLTGSEGKRQRTRLAPG